jgi:hypothetical protein
MHALGGPFYPNAVNFGSALKLCIRSDDQVSGRQYVTPIYAENPALTRFSWEATLPTHVLDVSSDGMTVTPHTDAGTGLSMIPDATFDTSVFETGTNVVVFSVGKNKTAGYGCPLQIGGAVASGYTPEMCSAGDWVGTDDELYRGANISIAVPSTPTVNHHSAEISIFRLGTETQPYRAYANTQSPAVDFSIATNTPIAGTIDNFIGATLGNAINIRSISDGENVANGMRNRLCGYFIFTSNITNANLLTAVRWMAKYQGWLWPGFARVAL